MATLVDIQGILGGLATQRGALANRSLMVNAPWLDGRYCPPASCWRSVTKRSLDTRVNFISVPRNAVDQSVDLDSDRGVPYQLSTQLGVAEPIGYMGNTFDFPPSPAVDIVLGAPVNFWDNTAGDLFVPPGVRIPYPADRPSVNGLVLIGMRARVTVTAISVDSGGGANLRDANGWEKMLKPLMEAYAQIRILNTEDLSNPWVNWTPVSYFSRPRGEFVAVPPLLWRGRGVHAEINWSRADKGGGSGAGQAGWPVVSAAVGSPLRLQARSSCLIEGLFVPDPEQCGSDWPGHRFPTALLGNHPDYDVDYIRKLTAARNRLLAAIGGPVKVS